MLDYVIKKIMFLCTASLCLPFLLHGNYLQNVYHKKLEQRRNKEIPPLGFEHTKSTEKKSYNDYITLKKNYVFDAHTKDISQITKKFIKTVAITHKELMYESLYNDSFGFYGTGKVIFNRDNTQASFLTHPEFFSPNYGAMIAYNIYAIYRSMILAGELKPDEPFHIVELGAGNGTLAYDILSFIKHTAKEEKTYNHATHWNQFFTQLQYTIGEISSALTQRQIKKNKTYIDLGKIKVIQLDARKTNTLYTKKIKGVVLSNELPDAFPVHKVYFTNNQFQVVVAMTTCNKKNLNKAFRTKKQIADIIARNNYIRKTYTPEVPKNLTPENIILPKKTYLKTKEAAARENKSIDNYIQFHEIPFPISYFPNIHNYIKRHGHCMTNKRYGTTWYINDELKPFMESVSYILQAGFILTIDYGYSNPLLKNHTRNLGIHFYPHGATNNIYKAPGSYDITTKVNFSELATIGKQLGLQAIFYGKEYALVKNTLLLNAQRNICMDSFNIDTDGLIAKNNLFHSPSQEIYQVSQCHNFKVLIQKTSNTKSSFTILADQEPL